MKIQWLFKRQCRKILLQAVSVWALFAALGWFFQWLSQWLDASFSVSGDPIGLFFLVLIVIGYTEFRREFNMAMQGGISRRHVLLSTLIVWGMTALVTTGVLQAYGKIVPHSLSFLRDLGYHGQWDSAAVISNVAVSFAALSFAALLGLTAQLLMLWVPGSWRVLIFLLPLGSGWWLAHTRFVQPLSVLADCLNVDIAAVPYWWPVVLAIGCLLLIVLDARALQVIEPQS
ncbi:hypothetical protein ACFQ5J_04150 [Lacticaseibacillus baoqingensis]|uniref:ABC transporter permease n=1 Tax=Lacticaseibacillus baoqingensis TaxID=2486013 RepID=A0ABW4E4D9_9LACO|nr:hypothetical protein [Lacticaseibacillus baoqingensis]